MVVQDTPLDDPEEERKRQEYLQRQSELELAEDTFGANDDGVEIEEDDMVKAINNIPLSSAQAHETAATKLAERLFSTGTENTPDARRKAARSKLNGMRFIQQVSMNCVCVLFSLNLESILAPFWAISRSSFEAPLITYLSKT